MVISLLCVHVSLLCLYVTVLVMCDHDVMACVHMILNSTGACGLSYRTLSGLTFYVSDTNVRMWDVELLGDM